MIEIGEAYVSEDEKTWNELWQEFDSKNEDKLGLEKINICSRLMKISNESQKLDIERELLLLQQFRLLEMHYDNPEKPNVDQISEEIKIFLDHCNDESYSYYSKRFSETKSFLNKWRYSFACWLLNKSQTQDFDNAMLSLTEYIENKTKEKNYLEQFHYIMIRYNVPKIYGMEKPDLKLIQTLTQLVYDIDSTENIRWSLEPIQVLCKLNKPLSNDVFNRFITIEHRTAAKLRKDGYHHAEQMHLNLTINLCDASDQPPDLRENLITEIHCMLAESNEDAAEKCLQVNNAMAAVMYYQNAVKEYQIAGVDKGSELLEKIRKATEKIEWVEARSSVKLPKIEIKGENGTELVNSISNLCPQIPDQDQIKHLAEDLIKNNPITSSVTHYSFNVRNPTKVSSSDEEILASKIMEQNISAIRIGESWLANVVLELEKQSKISTGSFVDYLKNVGLHDEEQIQFLESGISEHFKGNYISSIHTLVPQIEGTLRSLLRTKGILTLKQYRQTIMDKELGGILSDSNVENFLGRNLATFLKIKFTDYDGINFRNDISHALCPISDFNHAYSFSLIHIILILAKLSL